MDINNVQIQHWQIIVSRSFLSESVYRSINCILNEPQLSPAHDRNSILRRGGMLALFNIHYSLLTALRLANSALEG